MVPNVMRHKAAGQLTIQSVAVVWLKIDKSGHRPLKFSKIQALLRALFCCFLTFGLSCSSSSCMDLGDLASLEELSSHISADTAHDVDLLDAFGRAEPPTELEGPAAAFDVAELMELAVLGRRRQPPIPCETCPPLSGGTCCRTGCQKSSAGRGR